MMKNSATNSYIAAGRYNALPVSECFGIVSSLEALISTSNDTEYINDALQRLEALHYRIVQ